MSKGTDNVVELGNLPSMRAELEIVSKVETLEMSGATQFVVHGRLQFLSNAMPIPTAEPLSIGVRIPEELWQTSAPGDVLTFALSPTIYRPSLDPDRPDRSTATLDL